MWPKHYKLSDISEFGVFRYEQEAIFPMITWNGLQELMRVKFNLIRKEFPKWIFELFLFFWINIGLYMPARCYFASSETAT